ncbi:DEAD/DEAH box helicase [Photobacterium phosphoreum]|uniref:DEAD/DEAH box helicase n=1 Tax=Photobacterium phosphoreum TaxID=659 RepID=UPI001E425EBE|nr:DEAD/DEAH box helicase [Photobacterium phosphoreum]MCD9507391.1 DEAD/DEAH box helicase [Photobacterium phosphoreum]
MFDIDTEELIINAPDLSGLESKALPKLLTKAYAQISAARIRVGNIDEFGGDTEELEGIISEIKRLAFTNEAYVSTLRNKKDRVSAAFVAGTAHQLCYLSKLNSNLESKVTNIKSRYISSEVSAALLFLIAESPADAAEASKAIKIDTSDIVENNLLQSIKLLITGELGNIISLKDLEYCITPSIKNASDALYISIFKSIKDLARLLLGETFEDDPIVTLKNVILLSEQSIEGIGCAESIFSGPSYLAKLLLLTSEFLINSAVININSPVGIINENWSFVMRSIAKRRPYLWRNHLKSIEDGYLNIGTSSVISFPTGAGKSTLCELKIAATFLNKKKTIFLAPTLALVDQTAKSLEIAFPNTKIEKESGSDIFEESMFELPAISVMTPERCLALMSFEPSCVSEVGLFIFDECHLLHPKENDRSRRAIDSMLCLLNFNNLSPYSDIVLLSAMIKNGLELARWIESITKRLCLSLDLNWKPTRQLRGCVLYRKDEISSLDKILVETRKHVSNKNFPGTKKDLLSVTPYGFFCLNHSWLSSSRDDYTLLPILKNKVHLSTGTSKDGNYNWYLTPNSNQVAAVIASQTSTQNFKTLIFTQTIILVNSSVKTINKKLDNINCHLTTDEKMLFESAKEELGGGEFLYVNIKDDIMNSPSICHHSLLLPEERKLHESLYRRKDGPNILVATSTISQGMNLPSEVVIISGDKRFNSDANKLEQLEAHELLNAAGRAGRAGENSQGIVLIIPSSVVNLNDENNIIHQHWIELQSIFSQGDKCLIVDDPIERIIDSIQCSNSELSSLEKYFIQRLPVENGSFFSTRSLIKRSFGAFKAIESKNREWIESRTEMLLNLQDTTKDPDQESSWVDELSAIFGIPKDFITNLSNTLSGTLDYSANVMRWTQWYIEWLSNYPEILPKLIRKEALESVLGKSYKNINDERKQGEYIVEHVFSYLFQWMQGNTLSEIETAIKGSKKLDKCSISRSFVLRLLPELSYVFAMPAQVLRVNKKAKNENIILPIGLEFMGECTKYGYDTVEKLALKRSLLKSSSRVKVHKEYMTIQDKIIPLSASDTMSSVLERVSSNYTFNFK